MTTEQLNLWIDILLKDNQHFKSTNPDTDDITVLDVEVEYPDGTKRRLSLDIE